jgi:hypothetical protein
MNDPELFEQFLKTNNLGKRFAPSGWPQEQIDGVARYLDRARNIVNLACPHFDGVSTIYVDCVEHPEFNAWAAKFSDRYFIGINVGLLRILTAVVFRMLADHRAFREIGDPDGESQSLPLFTRITPDALDCDLTPTLPKNALRQVYAMHLCHIVFDFIVAHEVAHVGHGHVDYDAKQTGVPWISERRSLQGESAAYLESQAMEMDADFTAAEVLVTNVKRLLALTDQMGPELASFYATPACAMFDVATAVSIQSRLFGDTRVTLEHLHQTDHPPDRWRQLMVLNVMGNHVAQLWGDEIADSVMAAISRAIEEVEEAFERLTGQPQQVQGLHDVWHGVGWDYAAHVCECWNRTMTRKLAPFTHFALNQYSFDSPAI